jgi:glycosyltransferase involved in cell wall biosynthesis
MLSLVLSHRSPPLKILHIASGDLWAGAEVQAYTLLCALQDSIGVSVAAILLNDGELAERLRTRGIEVFIVPENALNAWRIMLSLRRLMLAWQPDVVHTHRTKENILGSIANRLSRNVLSVRTVHGAAEHQPAGLRHLHKRALHYLNKWTALHLQQKLIAVSADLRDKLAADFPRDHIRVIENGIDVEGVRAQVKPVAFREAAPGARHVGMVGRLVPVKRVDIFLEMATLLRVQRPDIDWRFHIFGDGPLNAALQAQAHQRELTGLTFHGHCRDIVPCIAGLDTLVICSDHEGLPMTLLEAMALRVPIVAHAVGGLVDALDDYAGGRLVANHAAADYAEAVTSISSAAAAAEDFRMDRFSAGANAAAVLRLYAELTPTLPAADQP